MDVNWEKSLVMSVTKRLSQNISLYDYNVNGEILARVDCSKILGVMISNDLSWSNQVNFVKSKANSALYLLRRLSSGMDINCKLMLYNALVRPHLDYCSSLWDPYCDEHIRGLEGIQNRAVRLIFKNYSRDSCITSLRQSIGLPTLQTRRKENRLLLMYKIFNNLTILDKDKFLFPANYIARGDHDFKLRRVLCVCDYFLESFFSKTVKDWNLLHKSIVHSVNISAFKQQCILMRNELPCQRH